MKFEFEDKEIDYIYRVLRTAPLIYNEVDPIIRKIIEQFNANKAEVNPVTNGSQTA